MTALQELRGALKELGEHLSLDLDIPEDGECVIDTGMGDEALISCWEETDQVRLSVPLLATEPEDFPRVAREALLINDDLTLTGTARIGLSPPDDTLILTFSMPASNLDAGILWGAIEPLLLLGREIRGHLRSGDTVDESPQEGVGTDSSADRSIVDPSLRA